MQIRKSDTQDIPRLIELSHLFASSPFTFDKHFQQLSDSFHPIFAEKMLNDPHTITLVVVDRNKIIGFISVIINRTLSKVLKYNISTILLLVVDSEFRKSGIGTMLVDNAVRMLFSLGSDIITVGTDVYNIPAINVYEKNGFNTRLCWHIFRYYRDYGINPEWINEEIDAFPYSKLGDFIHHYNRPVSLLKEPDIDSQKLKDYLIERNHHNALKGNTLSLGYYPKGQLDGWIHIAPDEIAKQTISLEGSVYKILDIGLKDHLQHQGIEKMILQDLIARLHDFELIEFWLDADNDYMIHQSENAGFRLSYSGISLHLSKNRYTKQR